MEKKKPIRFSRGEVAILINSTIGDRTVAQFAKAVGVSKTAVYDAMQGARAPCRAILDYMKLKRVVTKTEAYERETRRP